MGASNPAEGIDGGVPDAPKPEKRAATRPPSAATTAAAATGSFFSRTPVRVAGRREVGGRRRPNGGSASDTGRPGPALAVRPVFARNGRRARDEDEAGRVFGDGEEAVAAPEAGLEEHRRGGAKVGRGAPASTPCS